MAALEMLEAVTTGALPPAHVGIHAGPVVFQEGDYFGRTVNVAARIADYARPGEVLVSQEVADEVGRTPVAFAEIGPVELKGRVRHPSSLPGESSVLISRSESTSAAWYRWHHP